MTLFRLPVVAILLVEAILFVLVIPAVALDAFTDGFHPREPTPYYERVLGCAIVAILLGTNLLCIGAIARKAEASSKLKLVQMAALLTTAAVHIAFGLLLWVQAEVRPWAQTLGFIVWSLVGFYIAAVCLDALLRQTLRRRFSPAG